MKFSFTLFFAALACTGYANAQTFPERPVRLVVPFPAAGPLDMMARLYSQKLSEFWGKPVVVENRVGATGTIGADMVAKSPADGYTVLLTVDLPIVKAPALFKPPYDVKKDLLPIAIVADDMNLLVANPSIGANTLAELVALARAKPGTLTFSSAGNGSPGHLCGEMIKSAAGVNLTHVPYKGAAPAMTATLAGEVSIFCGPIPQGLPHVKSGKLRALGVTGDAASTIMPDVRPLAATYPGLVVTNWYGAFVAPRTPAAIVQTLRNDIKRTSEDPDIRQKLAGVGMATVWIEGSAMENAIDRDLAKWTRVVRDANIKAD